MNRLQKQLTVILMLGGLPAMAADPTFAMTGVALGQTLRLNVEAFPSGPCKAQLSFVDRNGSQYPTGPIKTVDLNPGQADFLDLNANTVVNQFGQRAEVRPVVTPITGPTPSACRATAELFDTASGFSLLALQPVPSPFVPTPPPSSARRGSRSAKCSGSTCWHSLAGLAGRSWALRIATARSIQIPRSSPSV